MLFGKYASRRSEARYPSLWNALIGGYCPSISSPSGLRIYDCSGKNNHGTFSGLTEDAWQRVSGRIALRFPNSPAHFTSDVSLPSGPFSVSYWDRVASATSIQARVQFRTPNTYPWAALRIDVAGYSHVTFGPWQGANGVRCAAVPTISASVGLWQHWMIVGNSAASNTPSDYRVFVNGVEQTTSASSLMSVAVANVTRIGTNPFNQDGNFWLDGLYVFSADVSRFAKLLAVDPIAPLRIKSSVSSGASFNRRRRLLVGA